jgi:hypothetical protein
MGVLRPAVSERSFLIHHPKKLALRVRLLRRGCLSNLAGNGAHNKRPELSPPHRGELLDGSRRSVV